MNINLRRPRCDSKLKTLPEDRQDAIFEYFKKHTQKQTLSWLAKNGVKTNVTSLNFWRSWYVMKRTFEQREDKILMRLERFKHRNPAITKKDMDDMGEFLFNGLAIDQEDVKTWNLAQQIQLKREKQVMENKMVNNSTKKLGLELEKHKAQSESARKVVNDTGLTADEKQARIRQILGTE